VSLAKKDRLLKGLLWDSKEAVRIQREMAQSLVIKGGIKGIRCVAGLDASYSKKKNRAYAAAVLFDIEKFEIIESTTAKTRPGAPYLPGFLSFREAPALMAALGKLKTRPHALMCDGQGIAHPRSMGLASHVGLLADMVSVGCAKTRLVGEFQDPGKERGDRAPLQYKGRTVGAVVRTRRGTKPVFVSPGHRIGVAPAADLVMKSCGAFRLPEPVRLAHHMTVWLKKEDSR